MCRLFLNRIPKSKSIKILIVWIVLIMFETFIQMVGKEYFDLNLTVGVLTLF